MIRQIMTKRFFLRQPSGSATAGDVQVARDLADTLAAHLGECVGMAANMIGERKRIVAVADGAGGDAFEHVMHSIIEQMKNVLVVSGRPRLDGTAWDEPAEQARARGRARRGTVGRPWA